MQNPVTRDASTESRKTVGSSVPLDRNCEVLQLLRYICVTPDIAWGIKLMKGNVGFANGVLSLPQWTAFLLKRLLA